jgi:phospholipid-binding lipoprotein MlaA
MIHGVATRGHHVFARQAIALAALAMTVACASTPETGEGAPSPIRDAAQSAARATSNAVTRAGEGIDSTLARFETPEDALVADPFEPFNRAMYAFNDGLDRVVLGPVASAYETIVPQIGRRRIRDFLDNWKSPVWLANDVLQGDLDHAGVTTRRFALNTTVGVLGFYDFAAAHADLPKRDEDFGQTLGVHGVSNGAYLMLPLYGPTTFRDLGGTVVDIVMDPFTWAEFDGDDAYRVTTRTLDIVDIRVQTDPAVGAIRESVDPYARTRAVYIQSRNERIRNGADAYEDLPDFE